MTYIVVCLLQLLNILFKQDDYSYSLIFKEFFNIMYFFV